MSVPRLERLNFAVMGLASPDCARRLTRRIATLEGVLEADVRFDESRAVVAVVAGDLSGAIEWAIRDSGFRGRLIDDAPPEPPGSPLGRNALSTLLPAALVIGTTWLVQRSGWVDERTAAVVTDVSLYVTAAVFALGRDLFSGMVAGLDVPGGNSEQVPGAPTTHHFRREHLGVRTIAREVPFGVAAIVAFAVALWAFFTQGDPAFGIPAAIVAGYHVAAWLEDLFGRRAEAHYAALADALPTWATVERAGTHYQIPVDDLLADDVVVVSGGQTIPCDGWVLSSDNCHVDEAAVRGDDAAHQRIAGQRALTGSHVLKGSLTLRPTAHGKETVLGRMLAAAEIARSTRARAQVAGDRLGAIAGPIALLAALALALWNSAAADLSAPEAVGPALAVLIIGTPWALAWASHVAVLAGLTQAARAGVLIRGADVLDAVGELDDLVFGGDGTLTLGEPEVAALECSAGADARQVMRILLSIYSGDPAKQRAFQRYGREQFGPDATEGLAAPRSFRVIEGAGVIATVGDREVVAGNAGLMKTKGIALTATDGAGWLHVAAGGELLARVLLDDPIRPDTVATVGGARAAGVRPMLVTVGAADATRAFAATVGIKADDVRALTDSTEQDALITLLQAAGRRVGVVRPAGVGDATRADVEIGLLLGPELPAVPPAALLLRPGGRGVLQLLETARRTVSLVRQNLWLASLSMLGVIPAALGFVGPVGAVGWLLVTLLLVGINGLRNGPSRRVLASRPA